MLAGHDGHRGDASVDVDDHALLPGGMLSGSERSEGSIIRFLIEEGPKRWEAHHFIISLVGGAWG